MQIGAAVDKHYLWLTNSYLEVLNIAEGERVGITIRPISDTNSNNDESYRQVRRAHEYKLIVRDIRNENLVREVFLRMLVV